MNGLADGERLRRKSTFIKPFIPHGRGLRKLTEHVVEKVIYMYLMNFFVHTSSYLTLKVTLILTRDHQHYLKCTDVKEQDFKLENLHQQYQLQTHLKHATDIHIHKLQLHMYAIYLVSLSYD